MMVEYEGRMGDDRGEYGGRMREHGGGQGVNSVGIPPVRKLLPPSPADPTLFGMTVLQFVFFIHSIFEEQQLLVRIGVLLVVTREKNEKV